MKNRLLEELKKIKEEISSIIGVDVYDTCGIIDYTDKEYSYYKNELYFYEDDDSFYLEISSMQNLMEQFFYGEKDGYFYVTAKNEEDMYYHSNIYVFKTCNEKK